MSLLFAVISALHFASLMTAFGASAFCVLLPGIVLPGGMRLGTEIRIAAGVALLTAIVLLMLSTANMTDTPAAAVDPAELWNVVANTFYGHVFIGRLALLVTLIGLLIWRGPSMLSAITAGAALALLGLVSHAATMGELSSLSVRAACDGLHLLAAGFWVGSLVVLVHEVLTTPQDNARLIVLLRRFSRFATIAVGVLVIAGAFNGLFVLYMPGVEWSGSYLGWLAAKLVTAAILIALALTNRFGILPALVRGEREAAESIALTVVTELSCAILVLIFVGFLGETAPMAM
jgi:putative copper export protein